MTVSFCVIAYNEEKAIQSLFADISSQTYPHDQMEIVLVDSMSTDNTRKLMEQFAEEHSDFMAVKVVQNPKKIQAAGWNTAIKASCGDIIMRIDAHTMIPKEFVEKNVACMKKGEDVVGGPRPNIVENDTPWAHTLLLAESSLFGSSIAPFRKGHQHSYVKSVFHGAYRREVFDKAGLFNENLGRTEDNEIHYRIRKAGYQIYYNPDIVSYQHIRNTWRGMLKQKFSNGYWIGLTLGICSGCFSVYHFVPACFLLAGVLAFCIALAGQPFIFIAGALIYTCINIGMSVFAVKGQKKHWQYFLLPLIFFSLHIFYGAGTVLGIMNMPFWRKKVTRHGKI